MIDLLYHSLVERLLVECSLEYENYTQHSQKKRKVIEINADYGLNKNIKQCTLNKIKHIKQ